MKRFLKKSTARPEPGSTVAAALAASDSTAKSIAEIRVRIRGSFFPAAALYVSFFSLAPPPRALSRSRSCSHPPPFLCAPLTFLLKIPGPPTPPPPLPHTLQESNAQSALHKAVPSTNHFAVCERTLFQSIAACRHEDTQIDPLVEQLVQWFPGQKNIAMINKVLIEEVLFDC